MLTKTWDALLNFESRGLITKEYAARHSDWKLSRIKDISFEFCATIRQARNYFESARNAEPAIKPLLLYYGVLGLARGLVLYTEHKGREANLDPRHGISAKGWASELASTGKGIENLVVSLDNCGTFRELIGAASNQTLVRFNSSAVQWSCGHKAFPAESLTITFHDLIARTPEIAIFSRRWLDISPNFFRVNSIVSTDEASNSIILKVQCPPNERDHINVVLGNTGWDISKTEGDFLDINFSLHQVTPYIWSEIGTLGIGNAFLMRDFPGFQICQIGSLFIISYILGMLARYHPSHWTALVRNELHDEAFPTIQSLINHVEERFPAMILDVLEARTTRK